MGFGEKVYDGVRIVSCVGVAIAIAACSTLTRNPVPESASLDDVRAASGQIRAWGDVVPKNIEALGRERDAQRRAAGINPSGIMSYLAISGGGSDGAFGAGLLVGWSEAGTRPKFDLVTGISTGSLIAPFAFLGSDYDAQLKEIYTRYDAHDIARRRLLISVLPDVSLEDDSPLAHLIAHYVTPDFVDRIATEHRKGRRLLIGTTHLDAQRPVIWDMGRIATSNDANALRLFRKVMLASASIPGVFPPVLISVELDGQAFDEMHVDGGVTRQVFIFPTHFDPRTLDKELGRSPTRRLFVIRNGRLNPEWQTVEPQLLKIAGRSISSLIKYQGRGDLDRMYVQSREDKVDFNLASIPVSFSEREREPFDLEYMNALFDVGYNLGRDGYRWQKRPPDF
jgi:predicted acylesterase/phospholipase RssA